MSDKKVIGFTCSTFDLLHAGHVVMLEECRKHCDYLIVGLQNDPTLDRPTKNKPIQSIIERQIQLRGCSYVDEIVVYNTEADLVDLLLSYNIDVRILGVEYQKAEFTGKQECLDKGIHLIFNSRDHSFSSSELRKRVHSAEESKRSEISFTEDQFREK